MTTKKDETGEERSPKKKHTGKSEHAGHGRDVKRFRHRPIQDYLDPEYEFEDEEETRRK